MDSVDFLEQNDFHILQTRLATRDPGRSGLHRLLIQAGLAKDDAQASAILISVAAAAFAVTALLAYRTWVPQNQPVIDVDGNSYSFEEYMSLVRQGKPPELQQDKR